MKISAVLLASLMPVLGEYVPVKYQFLNSLELERYGIYSGDSKLKDHIIMSNLKEMKIYIASFIHAVDIQQWPVIVSLFFQNKRKKSL